MEGRRAGNRQTVVGGIKNPVVLDGPTPGEQTFPHFAVVSVKKSSLDQVSCFLRQSGTEKKHGVCLLYTSPSPRD